MRNFLLEDDEYEFDEDKKRAIRILNEFKQWSKNVSLKNSPANIDDQDLLSGYLFRMRENEEYESPFNSEERKYLSELHDDVYGVVEKWKRLKNWIEQNCDYIIELLERK